MDSSAILPFHSKNYPVEDIKNLSIGIVISEWNHEIIDRLNKSCSKRLLELGLKSDQITSFSVPGSFELPWGAKQFLGKGGFDGIICFGCVVKGETNHDDYINHSVSKALMTLSLTSSIPVLFGVLTTNTIEQAMERSGGKKGNKGQECAEALIKMISASQELKNRKSKIGF